MIYDAAEWNINQKTHPVTDNYKLSWVMECENKLKKCIGFHRADRTIDNSSGGKSCCEPEMFASEPPACSLD